MKIKTKNIMVRNFCFHRGFLGLFILFFLNQYSYATIFVSDSTLIKLERDTSIYNASENQIHIKENTKIYVTKGTIFKNLSEQTNAEIVYIEKKKEESTNNIKKDEKESSENQNLSSQRTEKSKEQTSEVESRIVSSHPSKEAYTVFGKNAQHFTIPTHKYPIAKAIINKEIPILISRSTKVNIVSFIRNNQPIYVSTAFNIRPPPFDLV